MVLVQSSCSWVENVALSSTAVVKLALGDAINDVGDSEVCPFLSL